MCAIKWALKNNLRQSISTYFVSWPSKNKFRATCLQMLSMWGCHFNSSSVVIPRTLCSRTWWIMFEPSVRLSIRERERGRPELSVTNLLPFQQQRPFSETYVVSRQWLEEGCGKPVLGVSLLWGLPRGFVQLDRKGEINMTEVNRFLHWWMASSINHR